MKELNLVSSLVGFLTIALVALKLLGVLDWSWLWVTAPIWGVFLVTAGSVVGLMVATRRR